MPATALRRYTYAEYLTAEEASLDRNEYCQGVILAMAGGTPAHARLKTNLTCRVGMALAGRLCSPFDSDMRIRIEATDLSTYPDLSVICGPIARSAIDRNALTNPTALFEVLSKSTAGYDRGEKFDNYQQIPTLRAYVLVDYHRPHIDVYLLQDDGSWARRGYGAGEVAPIPPLDIAISVDEIYEGWAEIVAEETLFERSQ